MSDPAPGSPEQLDQLIEEIVAAAPPFSEDQRRRLAELLSTTVPVVTWPNPSASRRAA